MACRVTMSAAASSSMQQQVVKAPSVAQSLQPGGAMMAMHLTNPRRGEDEAALPALLRSISDVHHGQGQRRGQVGRDLGRDHPSKQLRALMDRFDEAVVEAVLDQVLTGMERLDTKARKREASVAIHSQINHANSVIPMVAKATRTMLDTGIRDIRNQGVIMDGINNDAHILLNLCFTLLDGAQIMPCYFYMCDMIPFSEHWRVRNGRCLYDLLRTIVFCVNTLAAHKIWASRSTYSRSIASDTPHLEDEGLVASDGVAHLDFVN